MRKLNKIISMLILAVIASGTLCGCEKVDKTQYIGNSDNSESTVEGQYVARNRDEADSQLLEESENNFVIPSDGAWKSMKFTLDGKDMTFDRLSFSTLAAEGWNFDPVVYGLQDLSAEKGAFYEKNVYLSKEGFDGNAVIMGMTNFEDTPCKIDDIQLWSIDFIAAERNNYPSVVLEGGITWGSSQADIIAAYGEPSKVERYKNNRYTKLTYTDNVANSILLEVHDLGGTGKITLESYD